jgi:hypothetical protein
MTQFHVNPFSKTRLIKGQKIEESQKWNRTLSPYEKKKQKENQAIPENHLQT